MCVRIWVATLDRCYVLFSHLPYILSLARTNVLSNYNFYMPLPVNVRLLGMETDWSALLKAVFGSAYAMSDLVNYPDVVSISCCRQQRDSYASCRRHRPYVFGPIRRDHVSTVDRFDHPRAVSASLEGAWPCDVTMTSLPVASSAAGNNVPCQSLAQTSATPVWNTLANRFSVDEVDSERFDDENSLQVKLYFLITEL